MYNVLPYTFTFYFRVTVTVVKLSRFRLSYVRLGCILLGYYYLQFKIVYRTETGAPMCVKVSCKVTFVPYTY